ncbi:MAG TPA: hypothetical protein PKA58_02405 [Polyangium sp.]|nr:hypothetical protein [Polyangium sp.]
MNQMQGEIDAELGGTPGKRVQFLGVNEAGLEAGNAAMTNGRMLPWLQDTTGQQVWKNWAVTFRDVVVLDAENKPIAVYNVTTYNLGDPTNYAALKQILLDAAKTLP